MYIYSIYNILSYIYYHIIIFQIFGHGFFPYRFYNKTANQPRRGMGDAYWFYLRFLFFSYS